MTLMKMIALITCLVILPNQLDSKAKPRKLLIETGTKGKLGNHHKKSHGKFKKLLIETGLKGKSSEDYQGGPLPPPPGGNPSPPWNGRGGSPPIPQDGKGGSPPTPGEGKGGCQMIRRRKNVKNLTQQEKENLRAAIRTATSNDEYLNVANFHGGPKTICPRSVDSMCCPHGSLGSEIPPFLPWHRLLMAQMEEVLGEPLPYWDWTEDSKVPDLWDGIDVPIRREPGERGACPGNQQLVQRRGGARVDITSKKIETRNALSQLNFRDFSKILLGPHNGIHTEVGCDMAGLTTAAYDPTFFLHHAYVDMQFAFWQELAKLRETDTSSFNMATQALPPFDDRTYNKQERTFQNHRTGDTFDYQNKFCYEYEDMRFDGMTPMQYLGSVKVEQTNFMESGNSTAKMNVFVGVVLPTMVPSGKHPFELCHEKKCEEAGEAYTFGTSTYTLNTKIDASTHYLTTFNVTELVVKNSWYDNKLTAKMTSKALEGLPQPVVIKIPPGQGEGGQVLLGPGQNKNAYATLLDEFDDVIEAPAK